MKPTEEQIKEIEREAREYAKKSTAPDKETPDWIIIDFKAGYLAALEKFPCSPEEAREMYEMKEHFREKWEALFIKEKQRDGELTQLQTELTVWKDTAEKFKEENEMLKEELRKANEDFTSMMIRRDFWKRWLNDYQNLKK